MIPIACPSIGEEEKQEILKVLDSGMLAQGEWVRDFEEEFAREMGASYGIATSSGTTALHLALLAAGVGPEDQVITTPFTFIASSNAILFCRGVPLFADIHPRTYTIDPERLREALERNPRVRALILVHLYGLPAFIEEILEIVQEYKLLLIEDCAQAHGALYRGQPVGSFGHLSTFSFYPTKNMTTGEGGMVLTSNEEFMERARSLVNHGERERYYHQELGFNYRMNNMEAALGRVQLKRLDSFNRKRRENAQYLTRHLSSLPGLVTPYTPKDSEHVFHQYTIRVREREEVIFQLKREEIGFGIYYPRPVYRQPFYQSPHLDPGHFPVTEEICREVLSLPVHPSLTQRDLDRIISALTRALEKSY